MHNSIRNRAVQAIWRFGCVLLLLALSFAGSAAPVKAAPVVFDNFTIPVSMRVFNPCAADGAGEYINLTGNLHLIFFEIHDKAGGVIQKAHANPQGLSGTGETTGVVYRGTGMTQTISLVKKGASITTAIDNQRFIGG